MERIDFEEQILKELNETNPPENVLAVWFLGQNGVLIKGNDGKTICIDPYLAPDDHRAYQPPLKPEKLKNIDYILITHDHDDHLDPYSIKRIAENNSKTKFIAPKYCEKLLSDCGVNPSQIIFANTETEFTEELDIQAIPAAHEEFDYSIDYDHRFVGYLFRFNGVTVYHAGDTLVYPELVNKLKEAEIDLAFLPINGRDYFRNENGILGNMDVREAIELGVAAGVHTIFPLHYDMFFGNAEKVGYFSDYLYEKYPTQNYYIGGRFQRYLYASPDAYR